MRTRPLLALAALALVLAAPACKKDNPESESPGVVGGVVNDVDNEIKGADETLEKTAEDIEGVGDDITEAVSSDDEGGGE
ncbi:MAG: hypothetical protein H6710_17325 [Myxococcales bacterium]|nr:hypothetical protein [Myxococcales bacterium]MCB9700999.1 hypothetical protein [Myxococcales bacterium]